MTGMHGVESDISYVPAMMRTSTTTLHRYLKNDPNTEHVASAIIGKWHLGGRNSSVTHPEESGVEYFAGLLEGTVDSYTDWSRTINGMKSQSNDNHTSKVTDLTIDWTGGQTQRWFLWLAYVAPHSPFHLSPGKLHSRNELTGTSAQVEANKRDYYLAAFEAIDHEIVRLPGSLSSEQRKSTVVIFIGDNGILKSGSRPTGAGNPGGQYDGSFRDDYEYIEGSGDLDECNGMTVNGVYGYYVTDAFPYIIACFSGTPDASFNKR